MQEGGKTNYDASKIKSIVFVDVLKLWQAVDPFLSCTHDVAENEVFEMDI